MAVSAQAGSARAQIEDLVGRWQSRQRWQRLIMWLPLVIAFGAGMGLLCATGARLGLLGLDARTIVLVTVLSMLAALAALVCWLWIFGPSLQQSARDFDLRFSLRERVSTAVELLDGRISSQPAIVSAQLDDALHIAQRVDVRAELRLRLRYRDWAVVVLLMAALAALLVVPNPQAPAPIDLAAETAIRDAAGDLRDITGTIAAETGLDEPEREALLSTLSASLNVLTDGQISPEEAFARMSAMEKALRDQAQAMRQQIDQQRAASQAAAQSLQQALGSTGTGGDQPTPAQIPTLDELLDQAQQQMGGMTSEQQRQMAEGLRQASQQLQDSSPGTSSALSDAAQSLENGDAAAASDALQDARDGQSEQSARQQQRSEAADSLDAAGDQAGAGAEDISQSSQPQPSSDQQAGAQPQPDGAPAEPEQSDQQGQPSDQGNTQSNANVQPGGQQNEQGGQAGDGGQPESGQSGGADAGDMPDGGPASSGATGPGPSDNSPDGTGETDYAPVYAPQRIGGEGDETIILEPDMGDAPVAEGEFGENPAGDATVPYNQVFSDYSAAANRALESDYVPLGLRDVIRDYFRSIEP